MDALKNFLAEYYWAFLIVGVVLLLVLIGFISSTKKKKETEEQVKPTESPQEIPQIQETPQPAIQEQPVQVNETPQDTFEPSLDSFSSTATEVNVGFSTPTNNPVAQEILPPVNNVQPQVQQPIDATPVAAFTIEDKPSVAINASVPQAVQTPVAQSMPTQSVNQPDPIEAEPAIGLVIEEKPSVAMTQSMQQPVQTSVAQSMPTQSVNQPDPIEAEPAIGLVIEDTGKTVGTTIN